MLSLFEFPVKSPSFSSCILKFIGIEFFVNFQVKPISSLSSPSSASNVPVPTHKQIAELIKEQKSAAEALQTFRWASKLPSFTHSQSTYRAVISKVCSFRRFDIVHQLLDEMPSSIGSPPDEDIFITVIRGLGRARMIRQMIKVLDLIYGFEKITPSLKIFNSILNVLVKEDIDIAREFYRKKMMGSGVEGDDYTFGILMKGLCLTNRIGDGFKLLQVMKSRGIVPNTVIYNTLLHSLCKNGKVGRARSLMNNMEKPNDVTFNILISAYCKEGNLVRALVLVEKSFAFGFIPDIVTVTKVVELLCNVDRAREAAEILERVETKGGEVDIVAYNNLIKGFCKQGKVKVGHHFFKEMERKGCFPNVDTYNALITGYCNSGMFDLALGLFDDMKTEGIAHNFITFDTLIKGFCSVGRLEDGFTILELMEETKEGSKGHISPYNSILYGYYKNNQMDEAIEFLTKMGKLFPRAVDRSSKILTLCEQGAIEDAKQVYNLMTKEGGKPSALVYDHLIHGFCNKGYAREAFELMNEMVKHSYFPILSTFNALIAVFCGEGRVDSAMKLVEDMIGMACMTDIGSYNPLVSSLCKNGDFDKAVSVLFEMIEKGIVPDFCTWRSLLLGFTHDKFRVECKMRFILNE